MPRFFICDKCRKTCDNNYKTYIRFTKGNNSDAIELCDSCAREITLVIENNINTKTLEENN